MADNKPDKDNVVTCCSVACTGLTQSYRISAEYRGKKLNIRALQMTAK